MTTLSTAGTLTTHAENLALRYSSEEDCLHLLVTGPGAEAVQIALADLLDLRDSTVSLVCQALAVLDRGGPGSTDYARSLFQELRERARRLSELEVES